MFDKSVWCDWLVQQWNLIAQQNAWLICRILILITSYNNGRYWKTEFLVKPSWILSLGAWTVKITSLERKKRYPFNSIISWREIEVNRERRGVRFDGKKTSTVYRSTVKKPRGTNRRTLKSIPSDSSLSASRRSWLKFAVRSARSCCNQSKSVFSLVVWFSREIWLDLFAPNTMALMSLTELLPYPLLHERKESVDQY